MARRSCWASNPPHSGKGWSPCRAHRSLRTKARRAHRAVCTGQCDIEALFDLHTLNGFATCRKAIIKAPQRPKVIGMDGGAAELTPQTQILAIDGFRLCHVTLFKK